MRVLFVGDVIGRPGRNVLAEHLMKLKVEYQIDFTIVNGENAAGGIGMTKKSIQKLFNYGSNVITSGNHTWKYKEIESYIDQEDHLIRPLNYPPGVPGKGSTIFLVHNVKPVAVINALGRIFMRPLDCPFRTVEIEVEKLRHQTPLIIIDFHAEATSEKNAFGLYFDGRVSAVIGTHTHIQTADERILPKGTAYITDVGMAGSLNSIIGSKSDNIIDSLLTGLPRKYEPEKKDVMINALTVDIDDKTGLARSVKRIRRIYGSSSTNGE